MDNMEILSTSLPYVAVSIKQLVNQGTWFLFKIAANDYSIAFVLNCDGKIYYLDSRGKILKCSADIIKQIRLIKTVYFSDIPLPETLSNFITDGLVF